MRHSAESTKFVQEWDAMLAGSPDRVDQIAFNTLVAKHTSPLRKSVKNSRLATGPKRQLAVGVLPVPLFLNGHTFFIQGLHKVCVSVLSVIRKVNHTLCATVFVKAVEKKACLHSALEILDGTENISCLVCMSAIGLWTMHSSQGYNCAEAWHLAILLARQFPRGRAPGQTPPHERGWSLARCTFLF